MLEQECPVCGKQTFDFSPGDYDREAGTAGLKLTPDEGGCKNCGFIYREHINNPMDKQVQLFLEKHPEFQKKANDETVATNKTKDAQALSYRIDNARQVSVIAVKELARLCSVGEYKWGPVIQILNAWASQKKTKIATE